MSTTEGTPSPSGSVSNSETIAPSSGSISASTPRVVPATPSTTSTSITDQRAQGSKSNTPKPAAQPTSFSEWQLLAVLHKANLVQYYDTFISQGGDDINQIMQCDEHEFLEIMSLVGMLSKPLHVRRLQRALSEFSKDQASFNLSAIQQIGPPPPMPSFPAMSSSDPIAMLMPGLAATLTSLASSSTGMVEGASSNGPGAHNSVPLESVVPTTLFDAMAAASSGIGATANVLTGQRLRSITTANKEEKRSPSPLSVTGDFISLGDHDPNSLSNEPVVLSEAQIRRIATCAATTFNQLPAFEPKLIQNKKKVSREVLDLMAMPHDNPTRIDEYRKYAAIYGRFDAKRKPDKVLSLHEVSVNEAAAQLCLLMPALLTRRDELFSLARQIVKDAGYNCKRRRPDPSPTCSPRSGTPNTDNPLVIDEADEAQDSKRMKVPVSSIDSWAATLLRDRSPSSAS